MRNTIIAAALGALFLASGCSGEQGSFSKARESSKPKVPKVPYVISGSKNNPTANLWSDAKRSAAKPDHKLRSGTKVKILETTELKKSQGGTMARVRAMTGEEGWIPMKFIEMRHK